MKIGAKKNKNIQISRPRAVMHGKVHLTQPDKSDAQGGS